MKDLIIGASTNYDWPKLKYWVNSINKSGFEGDKVLILFNCDKNTVDKVVAAGFTVVAVNKDADGNLKYESQLPILMQGCHFFIHHSCIQCLRSKRRK